MGGRVGEKAALILCFPPRAQYAATEGPPPIRPGPQTRWAEMVHSRPPRTGIPVMVL